MLDACGLDVSHMPKLYEGPQITGTLLPELAERWGMSSVPVAAGAGDNAAGAVGIGVTPNIHQIQPKPSTLFAIAYPKPGIKCR